ncbi:MAG: 3'(2'),5'-bisphosphate nucleotidase CysQ [Gammaproteobacteria bacterium]|nr:3'(2'),5'-bisphosphate nucleotidase CysQ [Gammaproteobacteria bacterium]
MEQAVDVAEQAALLIMDVYKKSDFDVQIKSDKTPVTQADLLAHHLIVKELSKLTPEIPILSEESINIPWRARKKWQIYWLIDPLDGTKEFVDRNGEFTINIALISNNKPIIGIVLAPAVEQLYMAAKNIGAFKQTDGKTLTPINSCSVPESGGQKNFRVVIGRRSFSDSLNALFAKLPMHTVVNLGSSLKTCHIAEGKADLYPRYGKTSEWDTAAAQCILECAGGSVTNMQLSPLKYNSNKSLLNPSFIAWGDGSINWADYLTERKTNDNKINFNSRI